MTLPRTWRLSHLTALLAVALLSLAGVRATVMQASMAARSTMPECGANRMPGGSRRDAPASPGASCAFCSVAAHAPLLSGAQPVLAPTVVAWAAWPPRTSLGARGPPRFEARARGPPQTLPTS